MLEDLRFAALEQWPDALKRVREQDPNGARPCLVLDKIGQYRRQVINDTRQNLPAIRFRPVDDKSDKETAEVLNGLARHVQDVSSADIARLTALDWAVTAGLGYYRILTEYTSDDSWDQDIRIGRIHNPFAVYFDPHSTEPDGSDAEWCFITEDVPKKAFERLYPKAEQGGDLGPVSEGDLVRSWFSEESSRVAEYFRIEREKDDVVLLADRSSMYGSRYRQLQEEGAELIQVVRVRPVQRRVVHWQKITGLEALEESEFPASYIPVIQVIGTEFWIEGKRQLSGLVRSAKDAQRGFNYHMSVATEMMGLGPRAPFIGAAGQFEGFEHKWAEANTENHAYLEYNPVGSGGTLSPPPQRQQPAGPPVGLLQMAQLFEGNVQAALGMYNASVGAPSNEKSGIAIRERKNEGDVGSLHYRGNLALSMRHEGRILLEVFSRIYDTARIARIVGEDGSVDTVRLDPTLPAASQKTPKGEPNIHNITLGRYDVSVDVGPAYATRRQDTAAAMIEMVRANPQLMQVAGDLVVRPMDWEGAEQLADRLKKALPPELAEDDEGGPQQIPPQLEAQMQQMQQAYEQQLAQAQQMVQGLQQQAQEASQAAQQGQMALKDKEGDHALKAQELELKAFEAETKRLEVEIKAREAEARVAQDAQAQAAQAAAETGQPESVETDSGAVSQAMHEIALALAELRAAKSIRVIRDEETGAMVGAEIVPEEGQMQALPALIDRQIEMALPAVIDGIRSNQEQVQALKATIAEIASQPHIEPAVIQEQMDALEAKLAQPSRIEVVRGPDGRVLGARVIAPPR
jgi:Phage P22-like portal protein